MTAQVWCTGPCYLYVGVGHLTGSVSPSGSTGFRDMFNPPTDYSPRLLGTCKNTPEIHWKTSTRPIHSDDAGEGADDEMHLAEEAMIFAELTWWDESTYSQIASKPRFDGTRGSQNEFDVGSLTLRQGYRYNLWLLFSYQAGFLFGAANSKVVFGVPGTRGAMPRGYRFVAASLSQDSLPQMGSKYRVVSLQWHAISGRPNKERPDMPRLLYDHDMNGLPPPA